MKNLYKKIDKFLTDLSSLIIGSRVKGIPGIKGVKGLKGLTIEEARRGLSVEQKNKKERVL